MSKSMLAVLGFSLAALLARPAWAGLLEDSQIERLTTLFAQAQPLKPGDIEYYRSYMERHPDHAPKRWYNRQCGRSETAIEDKKLVFRCFHVNKVIVAIDGLELARVAVSLDSLEKAGFEIIKVGAGAIPGAFYINENKVLADRLSYEAAKASQPPGMTGLAALHLDSYLVSRETLLAAFLQALPERLRLTDEAQRKPREEEAAAQQKRMLDAFKKADEQMDRTTRRLNDASKPE